MNRVETAIQEGRCVLAIGGRALQDPEVLMEIRRRASIPAVALGAPPTDSVRVISAAALAPLFSHGGGLLVIVEPDGPTDGPALAELGKMVEAAAQKPRLCIAARAFNPFLLPRPLQMLKMEQEKKRAKDFFASLPVSAVQQAPAPAPVPSRPAHGLGALAAVEPERRSTPPRGSAPPRGPAPVREPEAPAQPEPESENRQNRAPAVSFAGRQDELASLKDFLATGGPIAVTGPSGVGRVWLVEQALDGCAFTRVPDTYLGWGTETDALFGRLALMASEAGEPRLHQAWSKPSRRPAPKDLIDLVVNVLQSEKLANHVMVIHGADWLMRDDGSFHRNGRLEMLLQALLTHPLAIRLIFTLTRRPVFYKEGLGAELRVLELGGLKGRELYEIFDAYRFPEAPRDRMGEVWNQIHGHPLATRTFAIAARDALEPEKVLDNRKFLKMEDLGDVEPLRRYLRRKVEKLSPELRNALALAAHLRVPGDADTLQALGISRADRLTLMGRGLLDFTPGNAERRYSVHPLVAAFLNRRETANLDLFEQIGAHYQSQGSGRQGLARLALGQEANRCYVAARQLQRLLPLDEPYLDPILESVRELVHGPRPQFGIAEDRLNRIVRTDPAHTEAWLLRVELADADGAPPEAITNMYQKAEETCATPELYHHQATWYLFKQKRGDRTNAIEALQRGCAVFADNGRLRRRLAGLLRQEKREDEALVVLRETLDLEPMMPDTYGLMGDILMDQGPAHWDEARQHLEEAVRLAPDDGVHLTRLGRLYRLQGLGDMQNRVTLWASAREHYENAIKGRRRNASSCVELAALMLDDPANTDLDRVSWLLKQAEGHKDLPLLPVLRARLVARQGRSAEAENVLTRLVKRDPKNFLGRAALGEVLFARGRVFDAHRFYLEAQSDAPPDAPERRAWEVVLGQLRTLIESGEALEIQRRAEEEEAKVAQAPERGRGPLRPRREPKAAPQGEGAEAGSADEADDDMIVLDSPAIAEDALEDEAANDPVEMGEGAVRAAEIAEPAPEIAEPAAEIAEPVAEIAEPVAEIAEPVADSEEVAADV